MASIAEEIRTVVEQLSPDYQRRVLEFAQELTKAQPEVAQRQHTVLPPGAPGKNLLRFKFPLEDVEAMERALEDCERVEPDES